MVVSGYCSLETVVVSVHCPAIQQIHLELLIHIAKERCFSRKLDGRNVVALFTQSLSLRNHKWPNGSFRLIVGQAFVT